LKQENNYIPKTETAILVGISLPKDENGAVLEHLEELEFLTETAGARSVKTFVQNMKSAHPKFYVGPGKLDEIKTYVEENKIDIAIFDDELTPSQIRNIEEIVQCKIIDRTNLILDIFAARAQTAQAKTQVELAQSEYMLPRLTRLWTHLSRQKGGIGMRGPGEREIETDRRVIRAKISLLKEKLELIDKQNITRRKSREQKVRVSLVGYTNAGKSTIMNLMSDATVLAENKLFATLDTTVRKVVIGSTPILLSDTVGFIRKLPHMLIESFKSTLDEVKEADILLHIVDIAHPQFAHQVDVVNATLEELKADGKPFLLVYNKIDLYPIMIDEETEITELPEKLVYLKNSYLGNNENVVFIAAGKNFNLQELREKVLALAMKEYANIYPYLQGQEY